MLHHASILEKIGGDKNLQLSKEVYLKLLDLKSDFALGYNGLALLLDRVKNYQEAIINYNKAIEIEPLNPMFWNNRGCCFRNQGK